ncbi:InlB B-repeat-containing protein [Ruminococcus sp.]|uniref:InlB B-repeat-containing protein n=1 Tax=Ruminococcus sp. TaxID=41978 RepID=UPI003AB376AB
MKNKAFKTKLLTVLLTLCMLLSLVPISAFAVDSTVSNETELTAALENADCAEIKLGGSIETTWELDVGRTVTLDLNGYTLSCSGTDEDIIRVRSSGSLTIKDSSTGGKIDGQNKNCGIEVKGGTLTLESGSIVNCTDADGDGGAVDVSNTGVTETQVKYGKFIMNGGAIMDCKAGDDGGAVDIGSGCTFIMNGGTISSCRADDDGGAVFIKQSGSFELNGGVIQNCSAGANGGAVNIYQDGRFTMTSGTIKSCKVDLGGLGMAVYGSNDKAVVTMTGGTFEDCGAYPYSFDEFTVTFDSDGGSAVTAQKVLNSPAIKPADSTKNGYLFAGWYLEDMQYAFDTTVTTDITLKAHWTPISASTAISAATIENAKFDYQPGDAPRATAEVPNYDTDKYEIAYECWQEFENNEPVAAWYSDNGSHGSLPTITEFESGKEYVYFVMLKQKDGYSFSSETAVTVNGESVKSSLSGEFLYLPAVKTIKPAKQNSTITAVDVANVKLDYQPGTAPQVSAKRAGADQDKYDILFECWEKNEKDANDSMHTVGYWYSDESCYSDGDVRFSTFEKGGRYEYSVKLQAKDGYTFDSNLTNKENVTLNGASLPSFAWVMVMDDGKTCLITYGTELRPGQAVEKIDFNARINFNASDKPSFMTSAVNPFIDLDHERWDANDGSGYGITSSDYWNERYNGKLITEFEAGKSYTYGVYFKISDLGMEEGYRFDKNTKLYINGKEITLTPDQISVDDNGETIWFMNVLTMTPTTVKVIDVVEINGVTVSFKDGDKPVFTGKSPEGVKYAYNCEWWELDSKTGAISADFFSGAYENKITAFEAGKTYHYGVYVKAVGYVESENTTYLFGPNTKLKINGEFVNYKRYEGDESDGSDGTMWVLTDLTMTPEAGGTTPAEKYAVTYTDGVDNEEIFKDQVYTVEFGKATPAFNGTPARDGYKFTGWTPAVADTVTRNATYTAQWEKLTPAETFTVTYTDGVDNEEIFKDQVYTVEFGKATPAFNGTPTRKGYTFAGWKPAVAATVTSNATYEATWKSDSATTTPSDNKPSTGETTSPNTGNGTKSPKTGDNSNLALWFAVLFISGGVLTVLGIASRKKSKNALK